MTRPSTDWLDGMYGRLLVCFPDGFRARFGDEMLELFRARRATAHRRGMLARVVFPLVAVIELLRSAWRERRPVGTSNTPPERHRSLAGDARIAWRRVRRAPALAAVIVALLAVAIGSAIAVFTVVNAVLLRPLPYGDPDRIAIIWETRGTNTENVVDGHEFHEWARKNRSFSAMAAMIYDEGLHLTGITEPRAMLGVRVSASFFDAMGVAPALGRRFEKADDVPGHGQVAILSDRLWRQSFGADRGVIGRDVRLNDRAFQVIGVMPPAFLFPPVDAEVTPDVWMPIAEPIERYIGRHYVVVVGRLAPGVTRMQAQADLTSIASALAAEMPGYRGHGVNVVPLHGHLVKESRPALLLLFGAVGCLLLMGCANVAGLLIARNLARRQQIGLELALGASRARLARQLIFESLILSSCGGLIGVALAAALTTMLPSMIPPNLLNVVSLPVDPRVVLFAIGVTIVTGLVFGVAPAIELRRFGLADAVRQSGRSLIGGDHARLRRVLVGSEIALAVMLVLGAGLMMRALVALSHVDPGIRTERTLAISLALRGDRYATPIAQREFYGALEAELSALPGVVSVGATDNVPLSGAASGIAITIEGRPAAKPGDEATGQYHFVSPGYFSTIHLPVTEGRSFTAADARVALPLIRWYPQQPQPALIDLPQPIPVAVINEAMARAYWPDGNAVGKRFRVLLSPWITVAGVVANARTVSLRRVSGPEFYLATSQEPQTSMSVLVQTSGSPTDLVPAVRRIIKTLDPNQPVTSISTMDQVVNRTFSQPRFVSALLAAFASIALVLMTAGVYGLLAFTTAQRMPEMGVRLALGAPRGEIRRLILRDGLSMAVFGIAAGLAGAAAAGRLIRDQLFGVTPTDGATYATVTVIVLGAVFMACWLPARRAALADPVKVLRQD